MTTVQEHYEYHLGPIYSWMAGGTGPTLERGAAEVDELGLRSRGRASSTRVSMSRATLAAQG
jgi:hypothetical protein